MKIVKGAYREEKNFDAYISFISASQRNGRMIFYRRVAAYLRDLYGKKVSAYGRRIYAEQLALYNAWVKYKAWLDGGKVGTAPPFANEAAKPGNSAHEEGYALDINNIGIVNGVKQYPATILEDFYHWLKGEPETLNQYGLCHSVKTEPWHIVPIEVKGYTGLVKDFCDADDYFVDGYIEGNDDMITQSNTATEVVYDVQTAYVALGLKIGTWKNMKTPTILDGRDGKWGADCMNATKEIQKKYGLNPDGNVDLATFGKIMLELVAKISATDNSAEIARLKAAVEDLTKQIGNKDLELNSRLQTINAKQADLVSISGALKTINEVSNKY